MILLLHPRQYLPKIRKYVKKNQNIGISSPFSFASCLFAMDFYDNNEIVDLWTSEFLQDFDTNRRPRTSTSTAHVAFGRTTSQKEHQMHIHRNENRPRTTTTAALSNKTNDMPRISLLQPTKIFESRVQLANEYKTRISGQHSKVRGTQMLNFKIDISKAREKRNRQLQYSREVRSTCTKDLHSREIDSITRIVVQSFRNLIDCER